MNIDLLLTNQGEAGLVSDEKFEDPVAGIMYDALTGLLTLEFANSESAELNIPLSDPDTHSLIRANDIHIGVIQNQQIVDSRQVPLVLINDPFGGGNAGRFPVKPRTSVLAFENFMNRTVTGQPVHRDDLGDEERATSVMGGVSGAVMEFAPHLSQKKELEASAELHHAPQAPGLSMGMGGGGGGARGRGKPQRRTQAPPDHEADDE